MDLIADLRGCPQSGLFYGGEDCRKEGILIDGVPWIAKFPRTTRDLQGRHLPSYTSSPVSEHVGARIYRSLGIDAHETVLGYRAGKVVCACRDFTYPGRRLFEFKDIKNSLSDDQDGYSSAPSDGESIFLGDVLAAIDASDLLRRTPGVVERFWDMFVVDAVIKNPDRNNGNWGLLMDVSEGVPTYRLAPVYDLGSSLFSKRSDSLAQARLGDAALEEQDAFGTNVSCYRLQSDDGRGTPVHPFAYMAESANPDLAAAVLRIAGRVSLPAIFGIIDAVPSEAYGRAVLPDATRESHKRLIERRVTEGLATAAEHAREVLGRA